MKPATPFGFYVCGLFSAAFCVSMVAAQLSMAPPGAESGGRIAVRGLSMVLVPLAAVVTEALWGARPWAYRASLTLALVYAATLVSGAVALRGEESLTMVLWLVFSGFGVVPMLGYIHTRSRQLWPPARMAVPATRP